MFLKIIRKFNISAFFGVSSRAVSSIGTFLISLYLIKNLSVSSYGIYSSIFGLSMLLAGLVTSVFTTQMIAVTSKKNNYEINNLSIEYYYMQNIIFAFFLITSFLIIYLKLLDGLSFNQYLIPLSLLIAWGVASKDILTSRSFLIKENKLPLLINIASLIAIFIFLWLYEILLINSEYYGLELPIIYFITFMFLYLIFKGKALIKIKVKYLEYAKEAFINGKWAFLQSIARYFRTQSYILAGLFLLGVYEIGLINSVLIYVLPLTVLYSGISQYFLPKLSINFERNKKIKTQVNQLIIFLVVIFMIYLLFIQVFKDYLNTLIFRDEIINNYHFNEVLCLWLLISLTRSINTVFFMELQSMKMFKYLAIISSMAAILSFALAFIGTKLYGISGLMISILLTETLIFALLILRKNQKNYA
jgi:O-antigen/teichoic acid export membrane protein